LIGDARRRNTYDSGPDAVDPNFDDTETLNALLRPAHHLAHRALAVATGVVGSIVVGVA
jgi:hypothetical protein